MGTISVSTSWNPSWSWPKTRRERFIFAGRLFFHALQSLHQLAENDEMKSSARDRIILALDVDERAEALRLAKAVAPFVAAVKVGLQTFHCGGPELVQEIRDLGWMFFSISNYTIYRTRSLEPWKRPRDWTLQMLSLHLLGGREMICWGVAAAPPNLFAAWRYPC